VWLGWWVQFGPRFYVSSGPWWTMGAVRIIEVTISDGAIRLGPFLKLAGLVMGVADAKVMAEAGWVTVNGQVESQLGRQLRPGDLVSAGSRSARVVTADQGPVNR
jgi:ribosome-associated protein